MRQPSWQEQEHFLYPVQKGSQQGPATFVSIQEHSADLFTPRSMLELHYEKKLTKNIRPTNILQIYISIQ